MNDQLTKENLLVNDACLYRRVGNYAVESIYHLILKCTIFRECVAFLAMDLDSIFNAISIIFGIKCFNSTLDQIWNMAILLFINFAHSMRTSRPVPTKEILKGESAINFRNLCLFSERFKKNIGLVINTIHLMLRAFFVHMGLKSHVYSIVFHVTS